MRSTPCVDGCDGPMLSTIRSPTSPSTSSRMSPAETVGTTARAGGAVGESVDGAVGWIGGAAGVGLTGVGLTGVGLDGGGAIGFGPAQSRNRRWPSSGKSRRMGQPSKSSGM